MCGFQFEMNGRIELHALISFIF